MNLFPRFANKATQADQEKRVADAAAVAGAAREERAVQSRAGIAMSTATERAEDAADVAYAVAEYNRLAKEADELPFLTDKHRSALAAFGRDLATLEADLLAARSAAKERGDECNRLAAHLRRAGVPTPDRGVAGARHTAALNEVGNLVYASAGTGWAELRRTIDRLAGYLPRKPAAVVVSVPPAPGARVASADKASR